MAKFGEKLLIWKDHTNELDDISSSPLNGNNQVSSSPLNEDINGKTEMHQIMKKLNN